MKGELPVGWVEAKGGDVFVFVRGVSYKKNDVRFAHFDGSMGVLRATNINNGYPDTNDLVFVPRSYIAEEQKLLPGDIIIATSSGSKKVVGKVARVPEHFGNYSFGAFCGVARPYSKTVSKFLSYFMRSRDYRNYVEKVALGININNFRVGDLKAIPIPLPPLAEQRRIVRKLDRLTAHTTTARTHLTALKTLVERYKLTLLRAAFNGDLTRGYRKETNLEPVSALLDRVPAPEQGRGGRKPTTEVTEGKGGISVNIPNVALPEGWQWVSLLRVARQETGHTPSRKKPEWWGGDICWVSIPDAGAHHGGVISDTTQKTNELGLANSSARLLPAGTVILSRTASVGYVAILGKEMATSQDFATWTCSEALEPRYLMYALLSEGDDIREFGEGTTHTTIYFPEIRAFHIKLPPLEEQREIVRRIDAAFARIDLLAGEAERALKLVGHLDQRILERAFSGGLVSQKPQDEPAAALLARIKAARAATPPKKRRRLKVAGAP